MKIKSTIFIVPLVVLLASCSFFPFSSSESSLSSSSSESNSSSSSSSSEQTGNTFNERIANMVSTGVTPRASDANTPVLATYNAELPIGSAAHPLLDQISSEYLEIVVFEQPEQYGDAFLIKAGNAEIIIDFGNPSDSYFDDYTLYGNYLKTQYNAYITDQKLELMLISHPHSDHIGGLNGFLNSNVSSITMLVDYGYRYGSNDSSYYTEIRSKMSSTWGGVYHSAYDCVNNLNGGLSRTYITQELFIDWVDTGFYQANSNLNYANLQYLGQTIDDLNITSVVGILSYKSFSCFLTGDMQNTTSYGSINGETIMVNSNSSNPAFHQVTMLKVGHHGSTYATYTTLLNAISPALGAISAGRVDSTNSYGDKSGACSGHPHLQALNRLRNANVKTYLNSASGTLHFVTNGSLIDPVYFIGAPLKSSLIGGQNGNQTSLNSSYGTTLDIDKDLWSSTFYNRCHA